MSARVSDLASHLLAVSVLGALLAAGCASTDDPSPAVVDAGPPPCVAGTTSCSGDTVLLCQGGGEPAKEYPCPAGTSCKDGFCEGGCLPDMATCEANVRKICNAEGDGFYQESCEPGVCRDGGCVSCHPGTTVCLDDSTVGRCADDGSGMVPIGDCDPLVTKTVCHLGLCVSPCAVSIKDASNVGCEYWAVDLDNFLDPTDPTQDAANAPFAVVLSNVSATIPAKVRISTQDEEFTTLEVKPGAVEVANLPPRNVDGSALEPLAWRIESDMPLIAYQFNPLSNVDVFSNDASLLLPVSLLGTDYLVMSREHQGEQNRGFVSIVATQKGTTKVLVETRCQTTGSAGGARKFTGLSPGKEGLFELEQYDVLTLQTLGMGDDLTGATVTSDKPVAVFGGNECASVPSVTRCLQGKCDETSLPCGSDADCPSVCCCDHLEEQLFPVGAYDKRYIAPRSAPRHGEPDYWRILALHDGTTVETFPAVASIPALARGELFDFGSQQSFEIVANKPVVVGQFLASQDAPIPNHSACVTAGGAGVCQGTDVECKSHHDCLLTCGGPKQCEAAGYGYDAATGDPSFLLLTPVSAFRKDYRFLTPDKYAEDHVSVILPAGASLLADGATVDTSAAQPVGKGDFMLLRSRLSDGAHSLVSDQPIGVMVYGYDRYVSYGYAAGVSVKSIVAPGP
ncbi:MAG: hypothetical protein AMXMBFR64_00530 [Myxococcales bacterium]